MRLVSSKDEIQSVRQENQFNVVSFYKPSDAASVVVHEMVEDAMKYFDEKVGSGDWSQRSVGWLRVDLDATPELAFEDSALTNQAVIGPMKDRMLHTRKLSEDKEDDKRIFAEKVRKLTGDWLKEVQCDKLFDKLKELYDIVVYYGPKEDFQAGGDMEFLNSLSMHDRYSFDQQGVEFFYIEDPECKKKHNMKEDKKYIVLMHGETSIPIKFEIGKDEVNLSRMIKEVTVGVMKGTAKWGERA